MPQYLILAQSGVTARALGAWLELLGERGVDDPIADVRCILGNEPGVGNQNRGVFAYETLVRRIESAVSEEDLGSPFNEVIALVDVVQPSNLNIMQEGGKLGQSDGHAYHHVPGDSVGVRDGLR